MTKPRAVPALCRFDICQVLVGARRSVSTPRSVHLRKMQLCLAAFPDEVCSRRRLGAGQQRRLVRHGADRAVSHVASALKMTLDEAIPCDGLTIASDPRMCGMPCCPC
jgi:hypothetical protein